MDTWMAAVVPDTELLSGPSDNLDVEQHIVDTFPIQDFDDFEIGEVMDYTADSSQSMNSYLRGAPAIPGYIALDRIFQNMMLKYKLPIDVDVVRGVKNTGYLGSNLTGQTIEQYGFTSTSFDHSIAYEFAQTLGPHGIGSVKDDDPATPVIFYVHIPQGSPCLPVNAFLQADDVRAISEHELILPDGCSLYIEKDYQTTIPGLSFINAPIPVRAINSIFIPPAAGDSLVVEADVSTEPRDSTGQWTSGGGAEKGPPRSGMHHFDEAERESLKSRKIVIPPAWRHVQVADDPNSDLQVIGHDAKDRKQYLYSAHHTSNQAAAKFERIKTFHDAIPKLDHALQTDARDDDTAAAVLLMRKMGMRPGSEGDTKADVKAHGATNLRAGDVRFTPGGQMKLDFTGKDGVHIVLPVKDDFVQEVIQSRLEGKGKDDRLFKTNEGRAADYLKGRAGHDFKLKDMRTHHANNVAANYIDKKRPPKNKTEFRKMRNEVGDVVAKELGNTRTMALNSYISPALFAPWQEKVGI